MAAGDYPAWRSRVSAVVASPDGGHVLVMPTGEEWRLPQVDVADDAEDNLSSAVPVLEELLGEPVVILRCVERTVDRAEKILDLTYVLERLSIDTPPSDGRWVPRAALDRLAFAAAEQRELAAGLLHELAEDIVPEQRAPWAGEGWLDDATAWIDEALAARGRARSGRVEQVKSWGLSALLRVPTVDGAVFFKATAALPLFVDEGAVMDGLSRLFPGNVPAPLAWDSRRRWMLLSDLGPELGWDAPAEVRKDVLRVFARMQIESSRHVDELLALGCVERRLEWLTGEIEELLEDDGALSGLDDDERTRLRALAPKLGAMCVALGETSLPHTLVHGDLHLSNVARVDGRYAFFDWTDAAVSHPLFDLIDVIREENEALRDQLRDLYLSMWVSFEPMDRLLDIWQLAAGPAARVPPPRGELPAHLRQRRARGGPEARVGTALLSPEGAHRARGLALED